MATIYEATMVEAIDPADINNSYRGKTGCACGCGGDYFYTEKAEDSAQIEKHFKYIIGGIKKDNDGVLFFGSGVELSNPSYTTVTRIYFKDGIEYQMLAYGRIERRVKIEKAN